MQTYSSTYTYFREVDYTKQALIVLKTTKDLGYLKVGKLDDFIVLLEESSNKLKEER